MSGAAARGLILIRTHFVDARVAGLAQALAAGEDYDALLVVDETYGAVDGGDLPKLSISLDSCARLGLVVNGDKPLWRCGDYVFYQAMERAKAYRFVWLIEYDVVVNFADPLDFFRFFDARASEDYLCACLQIAEKSWPWRNMTARRFPVVYSAVFPLVRMTPQAIARFYERRKFEARRLRELDLHPDEYWLNDEGFISSAAHEMGLPMADFNAYGEFYTAETFAPRLLLHASEVPDVDGKIYHAVRWGAPYLRARKSYYRLDLAKTLACADPDFPPAEYAAALTDLIAETLAPVPDDPAAVFGAGGALAPIAAHFREPPVAEALLRALGRRRLRLCLEAAQDGRTPTPLGATPLSHNVALGRSAWQSSVSHRARQPDARLDAEGGNDGDVGVEFGFHTAYQERPWWAVDLGRAYPIRRLRIFNRKHAEQKLNRFQIELSDDFLDWRTVFAHAAGDKALLLAEPIEIALDPPPTARYLRILLPRAGALHLAEVEVYRA